MRSNQFWFNLKLGRQIRSQICFLRERERGLCLVHIVDQTQYFSGTSLYFHFDQQGGKVPETMKTLKVFEFFCWLQYC